MTNEEATKHITTWLYAAPALPPMQVVQALELAVNALRAGGTDTNVPTMLAGQPLTLEQLRGMHGKPVWIERNDEPHDGKWLIIEYADTENPDKTLYTREGTTYSDYGTYFTAYAYPPAHIDREAWELCYACKSCRNCEEAGKATGEKINYVHPCHSCLNCDNFKPVAFCRNYIKLRRI